MTTIFAAILFSTIAQTTPAPQPATSAPAQTTEPKVAGCYAPDGSAITDPAEQLLAELETADQGLKTLQARVLYTRTFELQGDDQKWQGSLAFETTPNADPAQPAERKFAVRFNQSEIGKRVQNEDKTFIFDGHWFTERNANLKTLTRREIVKQGEAADPMRIGDSPFPLPIGQKRADILSRYNVKRISAMEGIDADSLPESMDVAKVETFLKDATQLVLTPKPELEDTMNLDEIRLWYRQQKTTTDDGKEVTLPRWLPRMAMTKNKEGSSIVQLVDVKLDQTLPTETFNVEAAGGEGWVVQEEKLD
ncbi:MAG: hypothetical protein U0640_06195 [Phycisphaerales bacterium]